MLQQKYIAKQMNVCRGYSGSRGEQKHSDNNNQPTITSTCRFLVGIWGMTVKTGLDCNGSKRLTRFDLGIYR